MSSCGVGALFFQVRQHPLRHVGRDGAVPLGLEEEAEGLDDVGLVVGDKHQG